MTNNTSLANRLREVLLNGKWIANTNLIAVSSSNADGGLRELTL